MAFGDFTVTRASTKNVLGSAGLYVSVANNVPAFEFNTDGSYRGLLVEPGATNLFLRSQEINTTWTASNVTVTPNTTASPDGTVTADSVILNDTTASYNVNQTISFTSGTVYTISGYFKANGLRYIQMSFNATAFTNLGLANFDLQDGVVTSVSGGTARIELVGNGFYRCSFTNTCNVTTSAPQVLFFAIDGPTATRAPSFTNSGANGYFVWQAQLETGSVATSPIVTTAGTASRVADVVSLTGASSLIGQSEGTIFAEYNIRNTGAEGYVIRLGLASFNNTIAITRSGLGNVGVLVRANGANAYAPSSYNAGVGRVRVALRYKGGDFKFFVNGVALSASTDPLSFTETLSAIQLGAFSASTAILNDTVSSIAVFTTALSDAQSIALTTL
jgi:hypothetical protein